MTRNPINPDLRHQAPIDPTLLVGEFHTTYGHPISNTPSPTDDERTRLRLSLIAEEFFELLEATGLGCEHAENLVREELTYGDPAIDLVETADALADLIYVIYGYALELGIPLSSILEEVHASNMSKLDPTTGQPIYREDGKVLKGSNFREPDILRVLDKPQSLDAVPPLQSALEQLDATVQRDRMQANLYTRGFADATNIVKSALNINTRNTSWAKE